MTSWDAVNNIKSNDIVNTLLKFIIPSVDRMLNVLGCLPGGLRRKCFVCVLCLKIHVDVQVSKMNKDAQMRAAINQKLIETGERERLKELLRAKLIECGWKDQLKAHCKEVIKEKGLEHVTVDDLVAEITPKGRALVPDSVKKELLQRIRTFLAQHASL
uniref:Transcription and mRNA export factor ENY2 n=2 Tax=Carnivora TaxID=33554 RepID=A0A452V2G0_URSMA